MKNKITLLVVYLTLLLFSVVFITSCDEEDGYYCEHEYTESIITKATCVKSGTKEFTCSKCSYSYNEEYNLKEYTSDELYENVKSSVAEILTYDKKGNEYSLGSGFVFTDDGQIVTNYHVMEKAHSAKVTVNEKEYTVTKILAYDKDIDLAVIKINATDLPVIPICKEDVKTGSTVYAFGSSKGFSATMSNGMITYAARDVDGVECVQHNSAISSGNSGGPLVNSYGEIIGINTFTIVESQNLNFAIFTKELDNLVYDNSMTIEEFYSKEFDTFKIMKDYIIENVSFTSYGCYYSDTLGYSFSSDYSTMYKRDAYYAPDNNEINLRFWIDSDYLLIITIDEDVDGVYYWEFIDLEYDDYIKGYIYADSFTRNSLLGYYTHTFSSSSVSLVRELASSMAINLLSNFDDDWSDTGVTAEDLGFKYF